MPFVDFDKRYIAIALIEDLIIADGSVRLFVIVEVPGYEKWENAIRMKFNSTKPISFPVEMERMAGLQG